MPHFFVPPDSVQGGRFVLKREEARHLSTVLRKKPGDEIQLFDGQGNVYTGRIETLSGASAEGRVIAAGAAPSAPFSLRLFQGLPKGEKFDWVLEKMTELGASEIHPIYTERGVASIPADRLDSRMARWEKIVLAAAKQSGRPRLPRVFPPQKFPESLKLCAKGSLTLLPWEGETALTLKQVLKSKGGLTNSRNSGKELFSPSPAKEGEGGKGLLTSSPPSERCVGGGGGGEALVSQGKAEINIFIGPEGGFTPQEVESARRHGAVSVTLGSMILRTETAGLFVASALLYEWDGGTT